MRKEEYIKLINYQKWRWAKKHFDTLDAYVPKKLGRVDINTEEWIKFSIDYFDQAQQNYESEFTRSNLNDLAGFGLSKKMSKLNVEMGRNIHNSFELNYGIEGETNEKMIALFGESNRKLLNLHPDFLQFRLLVKMPGHGVAWHVDHAERYVDQDYLGIHDKDFDKSKFNKRTQKCQYGQIVRLWFPITDWDNGHMFQISETVLSHWQTGDVYKIPFEIGHCSGNAGYVPQITVSLTGIITD